MAQSSGSWKTRTIFREGRNYYIRVTKNGDVWKLVRTTDLIETSQRSRLSIPIWAHQGTIGEEELKSIEAWLIQYKMRSVLEGVKKILAQNK